MKREVRLALPLVLMLVLVSCAKRVQTPGVPPTPVTAREQFSQTNAQIAAVNHAIQQGAVQANAAGLLSKSVTKAVQEWTFKVGDIDTQVLLVVQSQDTAATKGAKIQALIEQLKASATSLIAGGSLGIVNPQSKQAFTLDVNSILTLFGTAVQQLQSGGIIQ